MLTLAALQKQFARSLNNENDAILQCILPSRQLSARQHFSIYQNSMLGALQNTLKDIFPVCLKLVGEDFFLGMMDRYIHVTQSRSPDLGDYGHDLPEFIETFVPARSLPYLADVTRLEWAWHKIFDSAHSTGIDFEKLAECYPTHGQKIIFSLPDSCFLLTSRFPIHQIWDMNQENYQGKETLILNTHETFYFLIWRHGLEMRIDCLAEHEWQILSWINQKMTLAQICEQLTRAFSDVSISEVLPWLVNKGWITDFEIATGSDG